MSRDDDAGFSCMEALWAILILSLFAGTGLSALRGAFREAEAALDSVTEFHQVLAADGELRRTAARVCAPYWLPGPEIRNSGDSRLRVNWVDGQRDSFAEFSIEENLLSIEIDGRRRPPVRLPAEGSICGTAGGIECTIRVRGRPLVIRARWSGRSLYHAGS